MNEVPMAGILNGDGSYTKGIEDFLLENGQYRTDEHQKTVVEDILENWEVISHVVNAYTVQGQRDTDYNWETLWRFTESATRDMAIAYMFR